MWKPPSLSELTPMIFNKGVTHLGSEASIYMNNFYFIKNMGKFYFEIIHFLIISFQGKMT